jgi:hypothetical protein
MILLYQEGIDREGGQQGRPSWLPGWSWFSSGIPLRPNLHHSRLWSLYLYSHRLPISTQSFGIVVLLTNFHRQKLLWTFGGMIFSMLACSRYKLRTQKSVVCIVSLPEPRGVFLTFPKIQILGQ